MFSNPTDPDYRSISKRKSGNIHFILIKIIHSHLFHPKKNIDIFYFVKLLFSPFKYDMAIDLGIK